MTKYQEIPTFPLVYPFEARISGAGIGGRDIAALIPSSVIGVWSRECLTPCDMAGLFGFTGVAVEPGVISLAVRTGPRRVRFSAHATRWTFGETECSRTRFLDI